MEGNINIKSFIFDKESNYQFIKENDDELHLFTFKYKNNNAYFYVYSENNMYFFENLCWIKLNLNRFIDKEIINKINNLTNFICFNEIWEQCNISKPLKSKFSTYEFAKNKFYKNSPDKIKIIEFLEIYKNELSFYHLHKNSEIFPFISIINIYLTNKNYYKTNIEIDDDFLFTIKSYFCNIQSISKMDFDKLNSLLTNKKIKEKIIKI